MNAEYRVQTAECKGQRAKGKFSVTDESDHLCQIGLPRRGRLVNSREQMMIRHLDHISLARCRLLRDRMVPRRKRACKPKPVMHLRSALLLCLHDPDLLLRQPVQLVHQRINLTVGRLDLALQDGFDVRRRLGGQLLV